MTTNPYRARPCHRSGCPNPKRRGRAYRYCSEDCAQRVKLEIKKMNSRHWRDGHRVTLRAQQLWSRYRMTVERFEQILADQGGVCAICGTDEPGGTGTWHIDHDHTCCPGRKSCGKCIRGLLCARCNFFILSVIEGPLLQRALSYIQRGVLR